MSIRNDIGQKWSSVKQRTVDKPWNPLTHLSHQGRSRGWNLLLNVLLVLLLFVVVFPIFWMVSTALRPTDMIYNVPQTLLPQAVSVENFVNTFEGTNFPTYFTNSMILSVGVVGVTTSMSTLAGYGLTRIDIPHKKTFARIILFGYMFPQILLAIPMFIFWSRIGLINSHLGLILAVTATALPFGIWLMWKFFQNVPISLEESAQMAGASPFRAFYEIALPMAKPGVIAVAIFSYATAWGAYTIPRIIMPTSENWPLTVGIHMFTIQKQTLWGEVMAASVMMVIPAFIFVFALQKYLLEGFEVGGQM
ncbi:carbohydrate ABC transporter permease [Haloferax chudinovii]|uniref:Carbohydrate ABC transporter permease n=1 Tax=Haloferax chudinovii TaxID=1109010 RepID=A0ABD5XMV2_9EURY